MCIADDLITSGSNAGSDAINYIMSPSGSANDMTIWGADGTTPSYNIVSNGIIDPNVLNEKDYHECLEHLDQVEEGIRND